RDAWKKLEGISTLEARHIYVEALLRVAAESYKRNVGREEAQQIIHAFAIMKPSGGDDSSDDLLDTDDASTNQEDNDDSSEALEQHQQQQHHQQIRPGSVASIQTMVTAPATPRQLPTYATRPPSPAHMTRDDLRVLPQKSSYQEPEFIDVNVNPWQHIPTTARQKTALDIAIASTLRSTATDSWHDTYSCERTTIPPHQHISTLALGPATKRALESLQNEVIALNDRIDDLRRELAERDKLQRAKSNKDQDSGGDGDVDDDDDSDSSYDMGDGWRWVIKAAVKYAGVNLMTAFILFFILYKTNSPIAFAILKQSSRFWQSFRLRVLISNVVV
ncbi:hypothetical protein FB192DRAFT_1271419, partial [Mucor lusitanicus]